MNNVGLVLKLNKPSLDKHIEGLKENIIHALRRYFPNVNRGNVATIQSKLTWAFTVDQPDYVLVYLDYQQMLNRKLVYTFKRSRFNFTEED